MNQNRMDTDQSTVQHSTPLTTLLVGAGIGAALMYLLDPDRGARRRHILGDKTMKALRTGQRHASDAVENARNHAQGKVAEVRNRVQDEEVTDEQLVARVRAELGRHVEQARAIEVVADGGTVTLRGQVLATELPDVVSAIERVRGVERVDNQLDVRGSEGNTPSLQS